MCVCVYVYIYMCAQVLINYVDMVLLYGRNDLADHVVRTIKIHC